MNHNTLSSSTNHDTSEWGKGQWQTPDDITPTPETFETPKRKGLIKRFGDKITSMLAGGPEVNKPTSFYTEQEQITIDKISLAEQDFAKAEAEARQSNPHGFAELDAIDAEINSEMETRERLARAGNYTTQVGPDQLTQKYRADKYNYIKSNMEDRTPYGARWKEAREALVAAKDEFRHS